MQSQDFVRLFPIIVIAIIATYLLYRAVKFGSHPLLQKDPLREGEKNNLHLPLAGRSKGEALRVGALT